MCVVCWQLPTIRHWTEDREGDASESWVAGGAQERNRRRDRLLRAQVLNRILGYYNLRVEDWVGAIYRLTDAKGSTALVQDLGELWPAVENMAGRRIDPLDPKLIAALHRDQPVE